MLGGNHQRIHGIVEYLVGLIDGFQSDLQADLLHIFQEQHGMIPLFLSLDQIIIGKAVQIQIVVVVGHIQIKVCAVKFFINLLIQQFGDLLFHNHAPFRCNVYLGKIVFYSVIVL